MNHKTNEQLLNHPLIRAIIKKLNLNANQIASGLNIFRTILDEQQQKNLPYTTKVQIYDENNVVAILEPGNQLKEELVRKKFHLLPQITRLSPRLRLDRTKTKYVLKELDQSLFAWSLNDYPENNRAELANWFKNFASNLLTSEQSELKGCFLQGAAGVGKTTFLAALANYLISKKKSICFFRLIDLGNYLKQFFNDDQDEINFVLETIKNVDCLLIDDLGNERTSEWLLLSILYPIIDYRQQNQKITCISSNLTYDELKTRYLKTPKIDHFMVEKLIETLEITTELIVLPGQNIKRKL